mmetsp:Transcript_21595/g.45074  ORF Transcript_21595/g.45074 Transcript_21595/m.45074 type:complete len:98 (+) Transcript_21595:1099-1392(+)
MMTADVGGCEFEECCHPIHHPKYMSTEAEVFYKREFKVICNLGVFEDSDGNPDIHFFPTIALRSRVASVKLVQPRGPHEQSQYTFGGNRFPIMFIVV